MINRLLYVYIVACVVFLQYVTICDTYYTFTLSQHILTSSNICGVYSLLLVLLQQHPLCLICFYRMNMRNLLDYENVARIVRRT